MNHEKLEKLFNPRSIAIIGATDKKYKVGYALFRNIVYGGYKGKIYPVNSHLDSIEGLKVYRSVKEIDDCIDLAIIAIPLKYVPDLLDDLKEKCVEAAVVIAAGGREIGEKGKEREEKIVEKARELGIRFLGPNCFGFINTSIDLNANFGSSMPVKGKTAFISQSGALFSAIMDWAIDQEIGFSYCVSIGNMADIEFGELIDYLGNKDDVETILIYMESIIDAKKFVHNALKVSPKKPIIIAKSGRSKVGSQAASSHTGAIAGKDFLYSAIFKRCGLVRADTVENLFDLTEGISKQPIPKGNRFVILTNAGGPGVMAVDRFEYWNLKPAELSEETLEKLDQILPPVWSKHNPVDIIGDATPERYRESLKILLEAPENDGIIGILTPQFMTEPYEIAFQISKIVGKNKPFYFTLLGGERLKKAKAFLEHHGIPAFETPEEAVDTMALAYEYKRRTDLLKVEEPEIELTNINTSKVRELINNYLNKEQFLLTEFESKEIFKEYGIEINETYNVSSIEEAIKVAQEIGYPLVVKVNSPDIIHKSEAKAVIVNIEDEDGLRKAYQQVIKNSLNYKPDANILGVSVEKMVKGGFELIIGSSRDTIFKQYIMFGQGGKFVEFYKDVSFGFPPLNRTFAEEMIKETKIYKLLKNGFRDIKPVNIEKLQESLIRVSKLVMDFPEIVELDINPLIAVENSVIAVDGRIKLQKEIEENIVLPV